MSCSRCLAHVEAHKLAVIYVPDPTWGGLKKTWLCSLCFKSERAAPPPTR